MSTHVTSPIPVVLVAGFLGSGKTTLMRHLIASAHKRGLRCAVIINEFGSLDVDAGILRQTFVDETSNETRAAETRDASPHVFSSSDFISSLAGGCACCAGRDELHETLLELAFRSPTVREPPIEAAAFAGHAASDLENAWERGESETASLLRPDVILMEASGLADPIMLLEIVTSPDLLSLVRVAAVVGVVDAARYTDLPCELAPLLRRQLQLADFLILNKADLVEDHLLADVEARIRGLNASARLEKTSHAATKTDLWKAVLNEDSPGDMQAQATTDTTTETASRAVRHAQGRTWVCAVPHPVDRARLEAALGRLPDEVWRVKGFVRLRGESGWFLLQYTGGAGGGRSQLARFSLLAGASEPTSALVFIGGTLDGDTLRREFGGASLGALW